MATPATIDELLERYLGLLDEYTKLRDALNNLQKGIYQDLARANFAAERGIRYGPDFYDDRMQSIRGVSITQDDALGCPGFKVVRHESDSRPDEVGKEEQGGDESQDTAEAESPKVKAKKKVAGDPLRWFGLLVPMPLRQAQGQAIQAIEEVVPKLVSVNAEMAAVEIEVRRARKRRAKAEMAAEKDKGSEQAGLQEAQAAGA